MSKLFTLFAVLLLSGCAHSHLQSAGVSMTAVKYLNPDVNGRAAPIMVSFYELTSPLEFKHAQYSALEDNAEAVLQNTLVDKRSVELQPDQSQRYSLDIPANVRYIGVTAGYRQIETATWRKIVLLPQSVSKVHLHITLTANAMQIQQSGGSWS